MKEIERVKVIQDYVNLMGKTYIILLSSLDEFLGSPLSTNEKVVLQILDEEPISIKEVSLRTGLALSTLTNVFDKMEDKRLVKRRHSRTDRRMVKIELDVAGRRLQARFNDLIKQISSAWLERLPEEDVKNFTSALEKTGFFLSVDSEDFQDGLKSLIEPLQITLAKQFKRR
jgi:DNA-binding MarR family transcriptional regulator